MDYTLIATVVRYAAMVFAGWLVNKGYADKSMIEPIVGLALGLSALAWYLWGKYFPAKRRAKKAGAQP